MPPKVSVILTSYNRPNLIGKTIESVINQTLKDWELFIMDDASNKETIAVISSYLNDRRIHYVNSGVKNEERYKTTRYATLINEAIPMTKGKYLTYLTDDTVYFPRRLQLMSEFLDKRPSIDIVYSSQKVQILNEQLKMVAERKRNASRILRKAANIVDHCSVMHTRRIAEQVFKKYNSYWDDQPECWHNGDAVFWMRLNEFQPFYPISDMLDQTIKSPQCFQFLNRHLPNVLPNGTIVQAVSSEIFIIDQKKRRKITPQMFTALKYDKGKIVEITDPLLFKYTLGQEVDQSVFSNSQLFPNNRLVKGTNNSQIYYIENNQKRLVQQQAFKRFGFKTSEIIPVTNGLLSEITTGNPLEAIIRPHSVIPDNFVFLIGSAYYLSMENQLHLIEINILKRLKLLTSKIIQLNKAEATMLKQGAPLNWGFRK
ncbi:hypothetical protein BKP45_13205 [Anaerobacillus alkalidiazotrophicus]|uniref:Glycosyltransferase 2-like domain-containing protein n=1 Tax=Anaerobacillus alkalidiazotrophicus TaxID=472963 RepID=A0A1S2M1D2_9BACI|nr:glycosyltransferase family A protein [Anaerobacillus alkalidiazotrophicus]OIJ18518.1 hypothetical protein BKP45_18920 [Anaerobacillus alkalidiazotrophicus]OIJ19997.1 hypothetical protein BKP45_13205 [Anaerobacillus alkalidiazotrophicus]